MALPRKNLDNNFNHVYAVYVCEKWLTDVEVKAKNAIIDTYGTVGCTVVNTSHNHTLRQSCPWTPYQAGRPTKRDGGDLRLLNPQPDTSLHCETS